ncbi:MAG: DsbA family protein [Candidatus Doudnabacteria bacterium]
MSAYLKKFIEYAGKYGWVISIILSVAALGFSVYNLRVLKIKITQQNSQAAAAPAPGGVAGISVDKLLAGMSGSEPVLGDKNAPVTMYEFADFQCPFCKRFFDSSLPELKQKYVDTGKVKVIFVNVAFLGQESKDAAEAAKCASDQGQFWPYHDSLYDNQSGENQGTFSAAKLQSLAKNLHLNLNDFNQCTASHKYQKAVSDETDLANQNGVSSTPTFLINGQQIIGAQPTATFEQKLDDLLKN